MKVRDEKFSLDTFYKSIKDLGPLKDTLRDKEVPSNKDLTDKTYITT